MSGAQAGGLRVEPRCCAQSCGPGTRCPYGQAVRELPVCGRGPLSPKGRKLFPLGERNIAVVRRYSNQQLRYQLECAVATLIWPSGVVSYVSISKYCPETHAAVSNACVSVVVTVSCIVPTERLPKERLNVRRDAGSQSSNEEQAEQTRLARYLSSRLWSPDSLSPNLMQLTLYAGLLARL